jgi:hypothetical protein
MREKARRFVTISRWEQMNRNPTVMKIAQDIKTEFALTTVTKNKRKANRDAKSRAKKRNMTHEQREAARKQAMEEFTAPAELIPTADQENYKEHTTRN